MTKALALLAPALAGSLVLLAPNDAHALGPIDLEVGAKAGIATNPGSGTINPLGFGLGARGGLSFLGGIYAGVNFLYYVGGSDSGISQHALQLGLEAGYGFKLAILTIRPQIGFGSLSISTSSNAAALGIPDQTNGYLYLEPGVVALISLGILYVGADVNALIIPGVNTTNAAGQTSSSTQTALTVHGQVGLRF